MSKPAVDEAVPNDYFPCGTLPPMKWRDVPPPVSLRAMVGPSVILAGLALGSGEFVIWPYITYKSGFILFWTCLVSVTTQYFMNMEIARWSLVTGESAITGFCRVSRWWAPVFLVLNLVPWMIPAWAKGAAQMVSWMAWGASPDATGRLTSPYVMPMAVASLLICGAILTLGPVIYETVERIQMFLVGGILIVVAVLAVLLVRGDAVTAMLGSPLHVAELKNFSTFGIPWDLLLGAIAFAGAGGTMNLGQSNYVKEKGYAMGHYIGRITSPITGKEEPISELGYHFRPTEQNLSRWRQWWFRAGVEHFVSFWMTCVFCLVLLTLIAYSVFYTTDGTLADQAQQFKSGTDFLWGEALYIRDKFGAGLRVGFFLMGVAIFLTTEFGVLDVAARISTDIVKVNWLEENSKWSEARLYYTFLWGMIAFGSLFLISGIQEDGLALFQLTSALNGGVMFLYCILLVYVNRWRLPEAVRMSTPRLLIMLWAVVFFGFFAVAALWDKLNLWLG